ncbi:MAG: hypothetical protein ONA90_05270 [candidate division KSB1 bacterium]|nr:hypothetical protein [candidate division KSB1 bacterium]
MNLTILLLFFPLALGAQEERSEKSFSVKPGGWVELRADFGSVDVRSWSQNEVKIEVRKWVQGRSRRSASELFDLDFAPKMTCNEKRTATKENGWI